METFTTKDTFKIESFLFIPRFLFEEYNLSIYAKLLYSLYYRRTDFTKFKDEFGPYIIYQDKDIMEEIGGHRATLNRARHELIINNLIFIKKGVGYNKIYLIPRKNLDKIHYTEDDLSNYQFYRYPMDFFLEKFDTLSLNVKLLYTIYFDLMDLSKSNHFVDEYKNIYFQISMLSQANYLGLSQPTIREARNILKAAHLLYEHQPFSQEKRYYLLKLLNYHDPQEYLELNKEEQETYLLENQLTQRDVLMREKTLHSLLKKIRMEKKLTQKEFYKQIYEIYPIAFETYRKYERGTRRTPPIIVDYLLHDLDPAKNTFMIHTARLIQTIINSTSSQKRFFEECITYLFKTKSFVLKNKEYTALEVDEQMRKVDIGMLETVFDRVQDASPFCKTPQALQTYFLTSLFNEALSTMTLYSSSTQNFLEHKMATTDDILTQVDIDKLLKQFD